MEGREKRSTIRHEPIGASRWLRDCALWCGLSACNLSRVHQLVLSDTADPTPAIPPRLVWPGVAVIIVIAIFITAALAGPIIRANTDEPPTNPPPADNAE